MKATDIMINDWVYLSKATKYPMRVTSIDENNCYLDFEGNEGDPFDGIYGEDGIAPIPLTEEILKLNGWDKYPFQGYLSNKKLIEFCLRNDGIGFYCSNENGENDIVDIHCVHELQHLLRIFGYGDLADDFKIE